MLHECGRTDITAATVPNRAPDPEQDRAAYPTGRYYPVGYSHLVNREQSARPTDNRLALLDQAFYAGHRAAGQTEVMQVVWGYERPVDLEALRRFHRNLAQGLLGRRIERSPLPFGRYRWVSDRQPSVLDVAESARPRAELGDWLDERAQLPIDPESGPGWRLSVLPLTDGSTVVTLVMSHYVMDGVGGVVAVALAIMGDTPDHGYPPPHARPRWRAVVRDAGETARDVPEVGRALVAALKEARRRRLDVDRPQTPRPAVVSEFGGDDLVAVPGVWIRIDLDAWDARAAVLGGTGGTLAAALTAKLGEHMGRRHREDGDVKMMLVVGDRTTENDTRAVALSFARVSIDPTPVTTDLHGARAAVKQALKTLRDEPDESSPFVALTPFTPKQTWRQLIDYALSDPDQPAVCSNLGEVGPVVIRPDGNPCDYAWFRGARQNLTRHWLERMGSQLHLYYGQGAEPNKVGIHVSAYQPGIVTTKEDLRDLVTRTLAEFGLTGEND